MEIHKLAELIPSMTEEEYQNLKEDIQKNGLITPIVIYENKILDGKHRYRVCQELGIEPKFEEYKGDNPVSYVVSLNLKRRHLTPSQRAAIALDILPYLEEEAKKRQLASLKNQNLVVEKIPQREKGRAPENAARLVGVNERYIRSAKKIKDENPNLLNNVRNGEKNIPQAMKELRKQKQKEKEEEALSKVSNTDLWVITDVQDVIKCNVLITDPPYGILNEEWEPDELEKFTREWLNRWNDCGADFFISFWSQRFLWDGKRWFDEELHNYEFAQLLIWHYPNNKSPQSRYMFKQTYEPILFYRRKDSNKEIRLSSSDWGNGLNDFDVHIAPVPQSNFNGSETKQHPAQKPLSVMEWLINVTTEPGELVCDPFCGSGTVGIAAVKMKRHFYGIEIVPEYIELARKRIMTYGI